MSTTPQIRPIAQRKNSLRPPTQLPTDLAPVAAINGICLSEPISEWMLDFTIDPTSPDFAKRWAETYRALRPNDTWLDLIEILPSLSSDLRISAAELWEAYQLRKPEPRLLMILPQLSENFRAWMKAKKIGANDLAPLLSLPESDDASQILAPLMPELQHLSRQDGVRALELWIELCLMDHPAEVMARQAVESATAWLERLKQLRCPRTAGQDQFSKSWLEQQSWPRGMKLKFQRQGDQSGIELKVTLRRPQDLTQLSKDLDQISQKLQQAPESLWPKSK